MIMTMILIQIRVFPHSIFNFLETLLPFFEALDWDLINYCKQYDSSNNRIKVVYFYTFWKK